MHSPEDRALRSMLIIVVVCVAGLLVAVHAESCSTDRAEWRSVP